MLKSELLRIFPDFVQLLPGTEDNHARRFPSLLRLFLQKPRRKIEKVEYFEIVIRVEERLASFIGFAVLVIAANIPIRP